MRYREEALCQLFYGCKSDLIFIEDSAETIYRKKNDIPIFLVSKSYFRRKMNPLCGKWFEDLLRPSSSAFVTKKTGWWLYHISEYDRIKKLHPLRLNYPKLEKGETLVHRTEAGKKGIDLTGLEPVYEDQTSYGDWYYLYKVKVPQEQPA